MSNTSYQDAASPRPPAYIQHPSGTYFRDGTPSEIQDLLERLRTSRQRIRIFYGDAAGTDLLDEHDVVGTVGRSLGPIKVPLLIEANRCDGPPIDCRSVARILDVSTKRDLFRAASYRQPQFRIRSEPDAESGYPVAVDVDVGSGFEVHARFRTHTRAQRWVDFMLGNRMRAH